MTHALISLTRRLARPRILGALVLLVVLAMLTIHVFPTPWSLVRLRALTSGVNILDMEPHYSGDAAYQRLVDLGAIGRDFYLRRILLGLDVVLPPLMGLLLAVGTRVALGPRVAAGDRREQLTLIPWVAVGLDYTENILIGFMLVTFPARHPYIGALAGWVTTAKQLGYLSGLVAIGVAAWNRRRAAREPGSVVGNVH